MIHQWNFLKDTSNKGRNTFNLCVQRTNTVVPIGLGNTNLPCKEDNLCVIVTQDGWSQIKINIPRSVIQIESLLPSVIAVKMLDPF